MEVVPQRNIVDVLPIHRTLTAFIEQHIVYGRRQRVRREIYNAQ